MVGARNHQGRRCAPRRRRRTIRRPKSGSPTRRRGLDAASAVSTSPGGCRNRRRPSAWKGPRPYQPRSLDVEWTPSGPYFICRCQRFHITVRAPARAGPYKTNQRVPPKARSGAASRRRGQAAADPPSLRGRLGAARAGAGAPRARTADQSFSRRTAIGRTISTTAAQQGHRAWSWAFGQIRAACNAQNRLIVPLRTHDRPRDLAY